MSKVATILLLLAACAHTQEVCEANSGNCSDADDFAALQSQMRQVGRHGSCPAGFVEGPACSGNQICPDGTTCGGGKCGCYIPCTETANCQPGNECCPTGACAASGLTCGGAPNVPPPPPPPPPAAGCPAGFVEGPACSGSQICPDGHTCGGGKCGCYIPCTETANCQPGNECCPTGACAASGLTCDGAPNVPPPPLGCPAGFVEGPACSGSQICPDGHTCGGGKCGCYIPCNETANCQPGNECCPTGACAASGLTCGGAPNVGQPPPPPPTTGSCPAGFVEGPHCTVGEQFCPDGSDCLNGKCGCYIPCTTDSQCQPGNACCGGQACAASGIGCRR